MSQYLTDRPIVAMNDHNCFGCGALNPIGLHLKFFEMVDGTGIWAEWEPTSMYEGYGGMIHGGIICTLLDEVMAWSLYGKGMWAVTARMETTFRKPIAVGSTVRLVGRIVRERGRLFEMRGEVRLCEDDSVLAEAVATFMRVPETQAQAWQARYLTNGGGE